PVQAPAERAAEGVGPGPRMGLGRCRAFRDHGRELPARAALRLRPGLSAGGGRALPDATLARLVRRRRSMMRKGLTFAMLCALGACSQPPSAPVTARPEAPKRDLVAEVREVGAAAAD